MSLRSLEVNHEGTRFVCWISKQRDKGEDNKFDLLKSDAGKERASQTVSPCRGKLAGSRRAQQIIHWEDHSSGLNCTLP